MLQVSSNSRIYVACESVDFRRGIDGLTRSVREVFGVEPMSGAMFLFCNRRHTALKILVYDGQGYWLCMKRLSSGRLRFWPKVAGVTSKDVELTAAELQILLWNGDPRHAGEMWKRLGRDVKEASQKTSALTEQK